MAHEPLHQEIASDLNGNKEELIANAIDALVYGKFILETSTRDANGKLRLFISTGNIFPESDVFVPYFAAPFEPLGDSTPGNAVLKGEVRKVVGPKVDLPRKAHFTDKIALLLDKYQKVFTAAEVVALAEILELDTSPPSTTAQQRSQQATTAEQTVPSWQEIFGAE